MGRRSGGVMTSSSGKAPEEFLRSGSACMGRGDDSILKSGNLKHAAFPKGLEVKPDCCPVPNGRKDGREGPVRQDLVKLVDFLLMSIPCHADFFSIVVLAENLQERSAYGVP